MDLKTNTVLDEPIMVSDSVVLSKLKSSFEDLGYLEITVSGGGIVHAVHDMDGNDILTSS